MLLLCKYELDSIDVVRVDRRSFIRREIAAFRCSNGKSLFAKFGACVHCITRTGVSCLAEHTYRERKEEKKEEERKRKD